MSQYFLTYRNYGESVRVELDLSSYVTNIDLKNVAHVNFSNFALKSNLFSLKTEID